MADLRDYTSLRVGGPAKKFVEVGTEHEIIAAIEAAGDSPILIIGGGTNILVADSGFEGTVIRIVNNSLQAEVDACSGATLTIGAGENWDDFVATTINRGFAGLETLSGIQELWAPLLFKILVLTDMKSLNSLHVCEPTIERRRL